MSPRPTSQISKKPRASKPKVKTGCRTCKRRHVKCDETKPECLRCANFGRKCEGYPSEEDDPPPKPSPPPSSRRLLSKALQNITPSPDLLPARASIESFLPFQDDHEYRYFCVFRDCTSIELAGGFDPSLWRRLVVQACDNTAIRELTTAVAALSLAGKQCPEAVVSRCFHMQDHQNHDVNSHLQYALMQYGSALKRVQRMVANGQDTIRIALIAALLIFVFENLHGDTDRAVKPIQSAIELILKRLSNMPRPYRGARTDPAHLQTPGPIEEELLSAFMRLCGPSLAIIRTKEHITTYLSNQIFTLAYAAGELHIPGGFATISEARLYLEDIRWRVAPSPNSRVPSRQGSPSFPAVSFAPPDFNSMGGAMGPFSKFSTSEELQLNQWHTSFTPLFEYSMTQAGAASFIPAAILYVQGQKDNLVIRHYAERSIPSDPNGELQIIGNILSVSRRLVAQPGFSRGFVFDQGIIPTLVMILMMCSDRDAKWETLDVLQSMIPRREGVWDSRIAAEAAEKMLAQEDGTDWMSNMGFDSRMRNDSLETMSSGEDFNFFNSDLESTSSDRDSIDPRLLGNVELGLDDEMNQMIDPVLRSRTPNMEKVSLRDFLCR